MIIFIGNYSKGFFVEDVAKKHNLNVAFINESLKINNQINEILEKPCKYMIFDIEQYIDSPLVLAEEITKISKVNNAKIIIYASGYLNSSEIISVLVSSGVKNFIFSSVLSDIKDELEKCLNGYFETNFVKFKDDEEEKEQIKEVVRKTFRVSRIGVAGSMDRIGTTTQAFQLVQFLILCGFKACYVEINDTGFAKNIFSSYEDVEHDEEFSLIKYKNIDIFYDYEKLPKLDDLDYEYYIYDYGNYSKESFKKASFLEKEQRIFVVGSKPNEIKNTINIMNNGFYKSVDYIFNFVSEAEKKDILDTFDCPGDIFFSSFSPDPFILSNNDEYKRLLQISINENNVSVPSSTPLAGLLKKFKYNKNKARKKRKRKKDKFNFFNKLPGAILWLMNFTLSGAVLAVVLGCVFSISFRNDVLVFLSEIVNVFK